jgi:hypothetical protein
VRTVLGTAAPARHQGSSFGALAQVGLNFFRCAGRFLLEKGRCRHIKDPLPLPGPAVVRARHRHENGTGKRASCRACRWHSRRTHAMPQPATTVDFFCGRDFTSRQTSLLLYQTPPPCTHADIEVQRRQRRPHPAGSPQEAATCQRAALRGG